jgi:hypothetical protein
MPKSSKNISTNVDADFPPLTAKEIAELKRQVDDMRDPTRYVIVSPFTKRFCLYYCPEDGNYIMNEIPEGSLFKRKAEAVAVAKVLERGRREVRRKTLQVVAVRKTKRGVRILEEVTDPLNKRERWKPVLRRRERDEKNEA